MKHSVVATCIALALFIPSAGSAATGDLDRSFSLSTYGHGFVMDLGVHSTGGAASEAASGCATLRNTSTGFVEIFCGTMRLTADPALLTGSTGGIIFSTADPSRMLVLSFSWEGSGGPPEIVEGTGDLTLRREVSVSGGFDGSWSRNDAWNRPATVQQSIQYP